MIFHHNICKIRIIFLIMIISRIKLWFQTRFQHYFLKPMLIKLNRWLLQVISAISINHFILSLGKTMIVCFYSRKYLGFCITFFHRSFIVNSFNCIDLIVSFNTICLGNSIRFEFGFLSLLGDQSCMNLFLSEILDIFLLSISFSTIQFASMSLQSSYLSLYRLL
jgi:hypothetical protein